MSSTHAPKRPVLRFYGGKWRLAPHIIPLLPPHRVYVEPFGGAASVLLQKPRAYAEIYNDLDGEVCNVFYVLQNPVHAAELERLLRVTPFARLEFVRAYRRLRVLDRPEKRIEQARRTIIKAFMGFGSNAIHCETSRTRGFKTRISTGRAPTGFKARLANGRLKDPEREGVDTGFRGSSDRSGTTPAHDWASWPEQIQRFVARLQGVVLENRDALEIIQRFDRTDTLHYVDPPYPHVTRSNAQKDRYRFEMTDQQHRALAAVLHAVDGMVVLSGYGCPLYDDELYRDWHRVVLPARADRGKASVEIVWLNRRAARALQPSLFEEHASQ